MSNERRATYTTSVVIRPTPDQCRDWPDTFKVECGTQPIIEHAYHLRLPSPIGWIATPFDEDPLPNHAVQSLVIRKLRNGEWQADMTGPKFWTRPIPQGDRVTTTLENMEMANLPLPT